MRSVALRSTQILSRSFHASRVTPSSNLIDGIQIAKEIRGEIKAEVDEMREKHNTVPGLAVVLVGVRKDSQAYVTMKKKACKQAGFFSVDSTLAEDATQEDLLRVVREHNADPRVHGILVQLPLPDHIDEEFVLDQISIEKDVDGFHTVNV